MVLSHSNTILTKTDNSVYGVGEFSELTLSDCWTDRALPWVACSDTCSSNPTAKVWSCFLQSLLGQEAWSEASEQKKPLPSLSLMVTSVRADCRMTGGSMGAGGDRDKALRRHGPMPGENPVED